MKRAARLVIFYSCLFGLWALLAQLKIWPPYLFPTPWGVGQELYYGFADHSYWIAIAVSMRRVLIGYAISVALGMFLGLGVASNKFLEETMGGLLVSLQSLPSICWWPLALLWFGLNQNAILFVVIMGSLLSVTLAMEDGRKQMPKIYGMAGRNLGARGFQLFWHVLMMGRETSNMNAVIAVMILIIALGYVVDGLIFKSMERHLQHKWGLTPAT
jgi:NitT/TauT family transport system permease protein